MTNSFGSQSSDESILRLFDLSTGQSLQVGDATIELLAVNDAKQSIGDPDIVFGIDASMEMPIQALVASKIVGGRRIRPK